MAYTEVRNFYGGLTGVSDAVLGSHVAAGQLRVADDGVDATDSHYQLLVNLATGAFMLTAGVFSGQITEKRVADVMAKYASGNANAVVLSPWEAYLIMLGNTIGIDHLISGEPL
jgi:hypothetical protein